jgi:hypothetical protein
MAGSTDQIASRTAALTALGSPVVRTMMLMAREASWLCGM